MIKLKTLQFRAHPGGDWMSLGVSFVDAASIVVPDGMELDARGGKMRWRPDTPIGKRDFDRREISFRYDVPEPTVEEMRRTEYTEAGATLDAVVVAMWEKVVENRPEAADKLQMKREQIKNKHKKKPRE